MNLMKEHDLAEFELQEEGFRIAVKRQTGSPAVVATPQPLPPPVAPAAAPAAPEESPPESNLVEIKAPIVGTFYRAPAPDAEPFVSVGDTVNKDTVVCIVEAMKVMNEIKAETDGVIRKILVENATPVQFGQVLFLVEPV